MLLSKDHLNLCQLFQNSSNQWLRIINIQSGDGGAPLSADQIHPKKTNGGKKKKFWSEFYEVGSEQTTQVLINFTSLKS